MLDFILMSLFAATLGPWREEIVPIHVILGRCCVPLAFLSIIGILNTEKITWSQKFTLIHQ